MCIIKVEEVNNRVGVYIVFTFLSANHEISTHEACRSPFMCLSDVPLPKARLTRPVDLCNVTSREALK